MSMTVGEPKWAPHWEQGGSDSCDDPGGNRTWGFCNFMFNPEMGLLDYLGLRNRTHNMTLINKTKFVNDSGIIVRMLFTNIPIDLRNQSHNCELYCQLYHFTINTTQKTKTIIEHSIQK